MGVIVGNIVVFACVFGGFALHGGNLAVIWQPTEYIIIGGAAIGQAIISTPGYVLKASIGSILGSMTAKDITKEQYMELLLCLFELIKTARGNILALEPHVENPEGSDIFQRYPTVLKNHHAIHFLADTLKVQISSPMSPYDLEDLMDTDLNTLHTEEEKVPAMVQVTGDAFPGLGIVAAVLGVVYTMGKLTEGKEVIGHAVAAALVGTFLGILASYGMVNPLAARLKENVDQGGKYMEVIKVAILAFAKDSSPKVCVEFSRRTVPEHLRPSFEELDQATANAGSKAA